MPLSQYITGVDGIVAIGIIASTRLPSQIHILIMSLLVATFDVSTNFWCIVLSYRGYNEWYLKNVDAVTQNVQNVGIELLEKKKPSQKQ